MQENTPNRRTRNQNCFTVCQLYIYTSNLWEILSIDAEYDISHIQLNSIKSKLMDFSLCKELTGKSKMPYEIVHSAFSRSSD